MSIIKNYSGLEVELRHYICNYKPKNWIISISNIAHTPFIMPAEARNLMKAHKNNSLDTALESLGSRFEQWYFKEAIKDYFIKEKFSEIKEKLDDEDE